MENSQQVLKQIGQVKQTERYAQLSQEIKKKIDYQLERLVEIQKAINAIKLQVLSYKGPSQARTKVTNTISEIMQDHAKMNGVRLDEKNTLYLSQSKYISQLIKLYKDINTVLIEIQSNLEGKAGGHAYVLDNNKISPIKEDNPNITNITKEYNNLWEFNQKNPSCYVLQQIDDQIITGTDFEYYNLVPKCYSTDPLQIIPITKINGQVYINIATIKGYEILYEDINKLFEQKLSNAKQNKAVIKTPSSGFLSDMLEAIFNYFWRNGGGKKYSNNKNLKTIITGSRGGIYTLVNGKKRYLKSFKTITI